MASSGTENEPLLSNRWTSWCLVGVLSLAVLSLALFAWEGHRRCWALKKLVTQHQGYVYRGDPPRWWAWWAERDSLLYSYDMYDCGEGTIPSLLDLRWMEADYLQLQDTDLSEYDLTPLHDLPQIKTLDLRQTTNVDVAIGQIDPGMGICEVSLQDSDATVHTLSLMVKLPIKKLCIDDGMTDAALPILKQMQSLEYLWVGEGLFSEEQLEELREAVPGILIQLE